ncbi:MAG: hypothetical protein MR487_09995 [Lachnospiraceae bacterium]|nr:hypothetical protein [Lachnospiraceae bacterium]
MSIKKVVFHNMQIGLEDIMEQFDSSGKEMYEDIVEELMEDASDLINPVGFWTEVRISHVSDEQIKLDEEVFSSRYLAEHLIGVEKAYAFVVSIGDKLWQHRTTMSDALEQYLFDAIMKTCLDRAFEETAREIVLQLPDKTGYYMDNPGHLSDDGNGWKLEDQKRFLSLLADQAQDSDASCLRIDHRDHFETSYSLSGIIYAKGMEPANCTLCPKPECSHRKAEFDGKALIRRLHGSAEADQ